MTRISQDMALSGSGNDSNRPIPHTLRPESPPGEEGGLTDVEDLEEDRSRSASVVQSPTGNVSGSLAIPVSSSGGDDGGVTDTELMSENEEDEATSSAGAYQFPEASNEEIENIMRNYCDEGEICTQDLSGDRVTVSRQTFARLEIAERGKNDDDDDALTDIEEMEGEGEIDIDIIDTDAPDFCPTAYGSYFAIIPEMLDEAAAAAEEQLKDEVKITETEEGGERKLSLLEFLNAPDGPLTDVESLESDSPRKLSVDLPPINRLPTPEFPVDPMTDEESIDDGDRDNKSRLGLGPARSITPSDCGDERLYENLTDEDEGLLHEEGEQLKKVSFKSALQVEEIDQGALTDCEDMQDSDDNDAGDEWKPVTSANPSELENILKLNYASAETKISMKDQEPEDPYPDTATDDEEIHCKIIDSKALTPRLVIYNHKDQLTIESDDEAGGGGITDTEDIPGMEGDDLAAGEYEHVPTEADQKVLQDILDANSSSVSVQESEVLENGMDKPRSDSVTSLGKGADTETEDVTSDSKICASPAIPKIVVPEGCGEGNPNGGNFVRRRVKKKHAKRKRDSAQSQFAEDEPRSGSHDIFQHPDVSASPSRVVESVGTFTERHQFWKEKDDEERKKRESVSSIEDYTQGFDNSGFAGIETIDSRGVSGHSTAAATVAPPQAQPVQHRTPSPYEIERSKEAIFLDTDDTEEQEVDLKDLVGYQQQPPVPPRRGVPAPAAEQVQASPERKVLFQSMSSASDKSQLSIDSELQLKEQINREIFESELAEKIETLEPESKSLIQEHYEIRDDSDKSETETTEKLPSMISTFAAQQERLDDVRQVASSLVSEIESSVERKFEGVLEQEAPQFHKPSAPSSVDITDEELASVGDISSPEPLRSSKFEGSDRRESTDLPGSSVGGTETGTPDTHAVRSSSSGEFFTATEDNTIRSSSDDPSRPKSWDSSVLGQVSNNFPGSHSGGSEYQTALGGAGVASSSESYLGSLSSDASASGTLVASQIDLGQDLLGDDEESEHAHIRTQVSQEGNIGPSGQEQATRSIYCEIGGREGIPPEGAGLPVTLTSSTSGTTVCTQVETTYEAKVKGDPELADDQDGNLMIYESVEPLPPQQKPIRTHRRSESQSWGDSPLRYGIEERIEEEQLSNFVFPSEDDDIEQDLFEPSSDDIEDPIQRPITPEPQFSPDDQHHPRRIYYSDSSFEQEGIMEIEDEVVDKRGLEFSMEYERVIAPQQRLEDIEEESSVKNSPKSVMSLEMSSSLPELEDKNGSGSSNGEKAVRPGSRESSSSLKEFETMEDAILQEETGRRDEPALSEIEEGHESQVSEISEATEVYGQDSGELEDDKIKSSQQYETAEDASQMTDIQELEADPMMTFFSSTIMDTQTPDTTETSQIDDFRERSENVATTDADSSLEYRAPGAKMTSSGDSLDDEKTGKNIMEVSRDSLDFEKDVRDIPDEMVASADSLTGSGKRIQQLPMQPDELSYSPSALSRDIKPKEMSDSLELQPGQDLPGQMTESADSLNDGKSGADDRSSSGATGAAGGLMMTSSDSLEGQAIDPTMSSNTSTAGDAAMWSSLGGGSASTLVSSSEDLTLENQ